MSIEVENKIPIYPRATGPDRSGNKDLIIRSEWQKVHGSVLIEIKTPDGGEFQVVASDLVKAIANATNTNPFEL